MKNKFILGLAILTMSTNSWAATLQGGSVLTLTGAVPDTLILDPLGNQLATGYYGVGYFNLTNNDVEAFALSLDITSLNTAFVQLAFDDFLLGLPDLIGVGATAGLSHIGNADFDPTPGIGRTLYTFIGNGADNISSDAFALYQHTREDLAADPVSPPPTTYDAYLAGGTLLIGSSVGPIANVNVTDVGVVNFAQSVQLVPEPSALLLSAFGVLGLLRRKR